MGRRLTRILERGPIPQHIREIFSHSMYLLAVFFLCRSQKIVPIFICFVIRKRLIIDCKLKAIALFFFEYENESLISHLLSAHHSGERPLALASAYVCA